MLKIERSSNTSNPGVVFTLVGRIEIEDMTELERLLDLEQARHGIVLSMQDVTLIDRDAVKFLASCERNGIILESCPAYMRGWIDREKKRTGLVAGSPT
jgi:hypothetical protein